MKKTRRIAAPSSTASAATPRISPRRHSIPAAAPSPSVQPPLPSPPAPALPATPIPPGYRELHQGEKILRSDHILVDGAWTRRDSPAGRTKSWALGESYNCYPDGHPAYHGFHHLTLRRLPRSARIEPAPTLPISSSLPLPASPSPGSAPDPGPGYRLLSDDEPLLAGDQINDTDGTWQKPLRRDDPPTLRQRRKNLNTLESRRAWPGRATQIQVRRKLPAAAAVPAPGHTSALSSALPPPVSAASPGAATPSHLTPDIAPSTSLEVARDLAAAASPVPDRPVSSSLPLSVAASAASDLSAAQPAPGYPAEPRWRQLTPGELLQPGDEVTARPTDDLQAPAGTQLWIAHRSDDPGLGQPVPARTPCRYRRLETSLTVAPAQPGPTGADAHCPAAPSLPPSVPPSVSPSSAAPKPGPGHRLLGDDDILRPGDQRTRAKSYAGTWEPVGATLHGLTTRAARRVYSPHNAEGQPDPLHFRRPYLAPDQRTPLALPPGTRELHPGEPILPTDHYLWGREWLPRAGTRNLGRRYHPGQNRLTIRALVPASSTTHKTVSPSAETPPANAAALPSTPLSPVSPLPNPATPPLTHNQVDHPRSPALLQAHTDATTASTQAADTPSLSPSLPPSSAAATPDPGPGYRALAPHEIIQPGDEWKCDGTGCPTYRTLNPHHGRTVAEVNAPSNP